MTGWIVPAATLAGAATLTYLMCVRPMRRSRGCARGCGSIAANQAASEAEMAAEIEAARKQLAALRADAASRSLATER